MKKLLLSITVSLAAFATAHAQYSQYEAVENFYQRNPDLDTNQYAGRAVNPSYWLVGWDRWNEMDSRMATNGFIRLGISNWQADSAYGGGIPQRDLAIAYARAIGADVVIYATHAAADKYNYSEHLIGFYAKQSVRPATPASNGRRPTSAEAKAAMNRFQDAHSEPHVKSDVLYDPSTDTYKWIGPKTGLRVSKSASWFLDKFGPYLY